MISIDLEQLEFIDVKLRTLVLEAQESVGFEFIITSLYRIGDSGVHGQLPLRGIDVRLRSETIGKEIETLVNKKWRYDPERPNMKCCYSHGEGSNFHLHFQTHPNTVKV